MFIIQVQSNIDLIPVSPTQKRARYIPCFGSAFWCLLCKLALKVNSAETAATNEDLVLLAAPVLPTHRRATLRMGAPWVQIRKKFEVVMQ